MIMIEELVKQGVEACRENQFQKGVDFFTSALSKNSENVEALYNRARALSKLGLHEKSLADFEKLANLHPSNSSFIGDYAVSLHLNNKNDEAAIQFDLVLKIAPNNPYGYSSRAYFKDRIGDLKGAIVDYERAIELDPEDAISLNNKGLIEEKLGYVERSKKSFDQSNKIVGYQPPEDENKKEIKEQVSESQPQTRIDVIKSIFTKEGFKDFSEFSKGFFSRRKK